MVIYGDVLFAVNFSMDFLALYLTGKMRHNRMYVLRMCLSAALGALYGVVSVYVSGYAALNLCITAAVGMVMCLIAFQNLKIRGLAADFLLFCGISFLMGGFITAVFGILNQYVRKLQYNGTIYEIKSEISVTWLCLLALASAVITLLSERFRAKSKNIKKVMIKIMSDTGIIADIDGMVDSGNLLRDPLTDLPVIILSENCAAVIFSEELLNILKKNNITDEKYISRIRMIPMTSVGGNKILVGYRPQKIYIDSREADAVICVSDTLEIDDSCGAIVPEILV